MFTVTYFLQYLVIRCPTIFKILVEAENISIGYLICECIMPTAVSQEVTQQSHHFNHRKNSGKEKLKKSLNKDGLTASKRNVKQQVLFQRAIVFKCSFLAIFVSHGNACTLHNKTNDMCDSFVSRISLKLY